MITVRSLAKSYGERQVLSDVDLDLPAGGVIGLVGANGAGKSTLLSVMARLLGADAGTVEVGGLNVATAPGAPARHRSVRPQAGQPSRRATDCA